MIDLVQSSKYSVPRSHLEMDLAARKAIKQLEGKDDVHLDKYANPDSERYVKIIELIGQEIGLTTLRYQRIDDMVEAVGLPKDRLCTFCRDGVG
ncbi:MAG: hypothetical protein EHM28_10600 [Spirochaetaceae bacterium]|nr:MAG: hypothetical protein EHM28_10600 [Spirochaetaceae bacterium]